jgi:hypothetical protein
MAMRYENRMNFEDDTVGKLVVTGETGLVRLFGEGAPPLYSFKDLDTEGIMECMKLLTSFRGFGRSSGLDELVGQHEDIYVEGQPLGGAEYAFVNNRLFLTGSSGMYGGVFKEVVERCLGKDVPVENIGLVEPGFGLINYDEWVARGEYNG